MAYGKKLINWVTAVSLTIVVPVTALASDNSIYIRQSGDNATVTMQQDGTGNVVRGIQGSGSDNTTPAVIAGNNNQVTVSQVGTGNILDIGLNTSVAEGIGSGNSFTDTVTGNNSTGVINSNATTATMYYVDTSATDMSTLTATQITSTTILQGTITYIAAS